MPTIQSHFSEEEYLHLINNYEKGDRSKAVREAYRETYMTDSEEPGEGEADE